MWKNQLYPTHFEMLIPLLICDTKWMWFFIRPWYSSLGIFILIGLCMILLLEQKLIIVWAHTKCKMLEIIMPWSSVVNRCLPLKIMVKFWNMMNRLDITLEILIPMCRKFSIKGALPLERGHFHLPVAFCRMKIGTIFGWDMAKNVQEPNGLGAKGGGRPFRGWRP